MLKLQRKVLEFELDDSVQKLKFPTMDQLTAYTEAYSKAENKNDVLYKFLEGLGLEVGIAGGMQSDHLEVILGALKNEKK